jgi:hypothetical protein
MSYQRMMEVKPLFMMKDSLSVILLVVINRFGDKL